MRVSTQTLFDTGSRAIQDQQAGLFKTQQQIATGRKILTPADDPAAAARVLEESQSLAVTQQHAVNRQAAKTALGLEEGVLDGVSNALQNARTLAVQAGNPALADADRAAIATELRGIRDEILGLANSTDGNGQYLFSGYQGGTRPFTQTAASVAFQGDEGQRLAQVGPSRRLAVNDSGAEVFSRLPTGNGTLAAGAAAANTGTGVIGPLTVTDAAAADLLAPVSITFTSPTEFTVTGSGAGLPATLSYVAGQAVSFNGWSVGLDGAPAAGDTFTVAPAAPQSVFKTLDDFIARLETPVTSPGKSAHLSNALNGVLNNLDQGLNRVLTVQSSVGARLKELDSLAGTGENLVLQHQQALAGLHDLDYAEAISRFTQQQINLQAAQQSFSRLAGLSLFNFL